MIKKAVEGFFNQMYPTQDYTPIYFKIDVLERYFKDPRFLVWYSDYRGSIALKDEYAPDDLDEYEEVRDFGLAYSKIDKTKRAVVVFAIDLKNMPIKIQGYWSTYWLDNQDKYFPNSGFVKNLIKGEWVEDISIFSALLMELHTINEMYKAMGLPPMFKKEFVFNDLSQNDRPTGYHSILLPTRENYYNFVSTLEKITTGNIDIDAFLCPTSSIKATTRMQLNDDGKEVPKGSVKMLSDWFAANIAGNPKIQSDVIEPLKKLVKLRQTPAHKLYKNDYDESIWSDQNKLICEIYTAIRNIRLLLANHPQAKLVKVDKILYEGRNIKIY